VTPTPASRESRRIRAALLAWYDREHRSFPWRGLTDPYAVLVS
jgi:A/G-specific adenine glycosylase